MVIHLNLIRMHISLRPAISGLAPPLLTTSALLASPSGRIFVLVLLKPPDLTPRVSRTRLRRPLRLRVDLPFSFLLIAPIGAIPGVRAADLYVPWALTMCVASVTWSWPMCGTALLSRVRFGLSWQQNAYRCVVPWVMAMCVAPVTWPWPFVVLRLR